MARDFPKYRVYRKGEMIGEYTSIDRFWQDNFVSFLIGCSFSFEAGLLEADVPVRQIEEHKNVPMYKTNIPCTPGESSRQHGSQHAADDRRTGSESGMHYRRDAKSTRRACSYRGSVPDWNSGSAKNRILEKR